MTIEEKIREFIMTKTRWLDPPAALTYEFPLVERRIIDSLDLLRVVAFLENEFKVVIDPETIGAKDFENISNMAQLIHRLQAAPAHAK